MNPAGLAVRVLAALGLAMLLVLGGMWAGHDLATTQTQAAQAKANAAALQRYQTAVQEGQDAASALREQLGVQGRYTATLQERARHAAPLTVKPVALAATQACAGSALLASSASAATDPGLAGQPAHPPVDQADEITLEIDADVGLTLAAVSLWNSALAQRDVAAGACRADAPASPACAAGSNATLADAWRNHAVNAASCAEDRARYQSLINLIASRQK